MTTKLLKIVQPSTNVGRIFAISIDKSKIMSRMSFIQTPKTLEWFDRESGGEQVSAGLWARMEVGKLITVAALSGLAVVIIFCTRQQRRRHEILLKGWRRSAEREIELKSAETVGCDQAGNDDAVNALLDGSFSDLLVSLKRPGMSERVLRSTIVRALNAHKATNCLTGILASTSLDMARSLDWSLTEGIAPGPLHGVPLSLKESYEMQGHDVTLGIAKLSSVPCRETEALVRCLISAGAVPFCRTNLPQTMLSFGCSNPIYGVTSNPYDVTRTCGGSSGGEAALIASGGSILGLGSDVGGSLRVPAAWCGIVAFKPTSGRISMQGSINSEIGQSGLGMAAGPMAKDVDALAACMRVFFSDYLWRLDGSIPRMPFNQGTYEGSGRLKIGYYLADGFFPSTPPCERAVVVACDALREAGHELVPFNPPEVIRGMSLFYDLLMADGGSLVRYWMQDEEADESVEEFLDAVRGANGWLTPLTEAAMPTKHRPSRSNLVASKLRKLSTSELWRRQAERYSYQQSFAKAMREQGIEAIVCPAHALVAPKHTSISSTGIAGSYTQLYNLLDFPAGTVRVGSVSACDEPHMADWPSGVLKRQFGEELPCLVEGGHVFGEQKDAAETSARDSQKVVNSAPPGRHLPIAVQVVAPPYEDELSLRLMREIEALCREPY